MFLRATESYLTCLMYFWLICVCSVPMSRLLCHFQTITFHTATADSLHHHQHLPLNECRPSIYVYIHEKANAKAAADLDESCSLQGEVLMHAIGELSEHDGSPVSQSCLSWMADFNMALTSDEMWTCFPAALCSCLTSRRPG